jgi:starch synthase
LQSFGAPIVDFSQWAITVPSVFLRDDKPAVSQGGDRLNARVLLVASEAVPLVKTGGLADVVTSLAHVLRERGVDAAVMIPGYPQALENARNLREAAVLPQLMSGAGRLWQGTMPDSDIPVVLLETASFSRRCANPYVDDGGSELNDNALCFGALAHAAVAICAGKTALPKPHIVHANDWHAGLIPALLRATGIHNIGTLFTIHNLAFQGNYPMNLASVLKIPDGMLTMEGLEFWGKLSFLKAGIVYADRVSTVSRSYAQEILTPRFGNGMEGILNARKKFLRAIPNGVDADVWNPAADTLIERRFNARDLRGKSACKRSLQKLFGLPVDPFARVLAIGSRITHQKMADVAIAALPHILHRHPRLQVIALGQGEACYERGLLEIASQFPERVAVHIGYDERRAHALHAGSDMLLHGTRFEPFGLTPLYSMLYGTIPIASRVGGMIDSIADAGLSGPVAPNATGILFDGEDPIDMAAAVGRAVEICARPGDWHRLQCAGMSRDFSWNGPADAYLDAYEEIAAAGVKHLFAHCRTPMRERLPQLMTA